MTNSLKTSSTKSVGLSYVVIWEDSKNYTRFELSLNERHLRKIIGIGSTAVKAEYDSVPVRTANAAFPLSKINWKYISGNPTQKWQVKEISVPGLKYPTYYKIENEQENKVILFQRKFKGAAK